MKTRCWALLALVSVVALSVKVSAQNFNVEEVDDPALAGPAEISADLASDPILNEISPVANSSTRAPAQIEKPKALIQDREPTPQVDSRADLSSLESQQANAKSVREEQEGEYKKVRSQVVATQFARDAALQRLKKSMEEIEVRKKELHVMRANLAKLQQERDHAKESADTAEQKAIELKAEQAVIAETKSSLQADLSKTKQESPSKSKPFNQEEIALLNSPSEDESDLSAGGVGGAGGKRSKKMQARVSVKAGLQKRLPPKLAASEPADESRGDIGSKSATVLPVEVDAANSVASADSVDSKVAKRMAKKSFLVNRQKTVVASSGGAGAAAAGDLTAERKVASVSAPEVDAASSDDAKKLILKRDCNVRTKAAVNAPLVQIYEKGAQLSGEKISPNWWKVQDNQGQSGFLANFCLK